MSTTMMIIGYVGAGFLTACRAAALLAWNMMKNSRDDYPSLHRNRTEPSGDQWFGSGLLGLLAGAIWPVTVTVIAFRHKLLAPPKQIRQEQLEARTEKLERATGII